MLQKCILCKGEFGCVVNSENALRYRQCKECEAFVQTSSSNFLEDFERSQEEYFNGDPTEVFAQPTPLFNERWAFREWLCRHYLIEKSTVLEVGPGSGVLAQILEKNGFNYTGCEHSPSFSDYLRDKGLKIYTGAFENSQVTKFKEEFDAIISMHIIEHLPNPQKHLARAYDVVKPGGIMILCTPNSKSIYHKIPYKFASNFDEAHLFVFSAESITHMARNAGWMVETVMTHEYTSDWLRLVSRMLRLLKGENAGATAGKYSKQANNPSTGKVIKIICLLSAPLRWLQSRLGLGNEINVVLRKPR